MKITLSRILIFIYLILLNQIVYAVYNWPLKETDIQSIGSIITKEKIYTAIEASGEVVTIHSGEIIFQRKKSQDSILPSIIELKGDDGILYIYLNVISYGSIGDRVEQGMKLGMIDDEMLLLRAIEDGYDIDLLSILPNIKRKIVIRIVNFTLERVDNETNTRIKSDFARRISSGKQDIDISINIKDVNSSYSVVPNLVVINFLDLEYIFTRDMILDSKQPLGAIENGQINIHLPKLNIPSARYIDFFVRVESPFITHRQFRFSTFANIIDE